MQNALNFCNSEERKQTKNMYHSLVDKKMTKTSSGKDYWSEHDSQQH